MAKARLFNVLKILCYCLGFPLFIALAVLNSLAVTANAPGYGFWSFIGAILVAALGIVYLVIGLIICRKKSKRTIVTQTVAMSLIGLIICLAVGLVFDKMLPDILDDATSDTLHYSDVQYDWLAQSDENGHIVKEFVCRNLLNGNLNAALTEEYKGKDVKNIGVYDDNDVLRLDYYYLCENDDTDIRNDSGIAYDKLGSYKTELEKSGREFDEDFDQSELVYEYVEKVLTKEEGELFATVKDNYVKFDFGVKNPNDLRNSLIALNYVLTIQNAYDKIILECASNQGVKDLIDTAFPSIDQDGYVTFVDCLLNYANGGRQTVPVLAHVILDRRPTYSSENPDEALKFKSYDVKTGETTEEPVYWTILDMDGGEGITVDLSSVAQSEAGGYVVTVLGMLKLDNIREKLAKVVGDEAVAGAPLYVSVLSGNGYLEIVVRPSNVQRGVLGYQDMAWLNSNHLLVAIISAVSTRTLFYTFAAVIAVTTYLAGMCRIVVADCVKKSGKGKKEKKKKGKKAQDNAQENADEQPAAQAEVQADAEVQTQEQPA